MTVQDIAAPAASPAPLAGLRTVAVIDRGLPKGLAANAAAVLAVTLGRQRPDLVGPDFADGAGEPHLGLYPAGLPVLGADRGVLARLRAEARARDVLVVDLPAAAQQTNDYGEFRARVAATPAGELSYLGLLLSGPAKAVRALTGDLPLLR